MLEQRTESQVGKRTFDANQIEAKMLEVSGVSCVISDRRVRLPRIDALGVLAQIVRENCQEDIAWTALQPSMRQLEARRRIKIEKMNYLGKRTQDSLSAEDLRIIGEYYLKLGHRESYSSNYYEQRFVELMQEGIL